VHPGSGASRLCLWRFAITLIPHVEIDNMMEAYVEREEAKT
jgi:hypothetical protein